MPINLGDADRLMRLGMVAFITILYLAGVVSGALAIIPCMVAAVFIVTSLLEARPLYLPFGFLTNRAETIAFSKGALIRGG
jgi:hypothetical protein